MLTRSFKAMSTAPQANINTFPVASHHACTTTSLTSSHPSTYHVPPSPIPMSPPSPILLTGTTGGLGTTILHHLLHTHNLDPASIIATSRSPSNRSKYESQGVQFRELDFARPETLGPALEGVGLLLFVSSSERDTPTRNREHGNVIDAAVRAGVIAVWYVSLAFGGWGDESEVTFMEAHLWTEERLRT
jgi:uncharacterized protein YbjT (DUF2867 family)